MSDVKIGQISVTLHKPPANTAKIACGHVALDVGYAAGYSFITELAKIREALVTARAVLTARGLAGATSSDELHLTRLLVDLEVYS